MNTFIQKLRTAFSPSWLKSRSSPGSVAARNCLLRPGLPSTSEASGIIPIDEFGWWRERSLPGPSLDEAARLFNELGGEILIEIGSGLHGGLAGNSILTWVAKTRARQIIAVDPDEERIREVQEATSRYGNVHAVVADGIDYLGRFAGTIHLLYLDFWMPDPEGTLPGTGRAEGYREAYRAARDKLNAHALILIDDTDHVHPWKHTYVVPEARRDGFRVVHVGRQTLLKR
jgi:hypothetical protein